MFVKWKERLSGANFMVIALCKQRLCLQQESSFSILITPSKLTLPEFTLNTPHFIPWDTATIYRCELRKCGASAPLFCVFLLAITSPSYRSKTPKSKITVLRVESGTALAPILTQRIICHLIAHIYVQLASLAAHEGMQNGRGECHDRSTYQFVSHPLLRKMSSLHGNEEIFPFSQILNANL